MATQIDVAAEVNGLVQRVNDAAQDEHEARGLLMLASSLMSQAFIAAQRDADDATATLVLQARAVASGVSVADQLNAAGALLKKRAEDVTPSDALNVVLFTAAPAAPAPVDDIKPAPLPAPAQVAPSA